MPVNNTSACYAKRSPQWKRMRALAEGHGAEKAYIHKLPGQPDDSFKLFKERAYYLNATQRTIDALVGLPLARNPKLVIPTGLDYVKNHATRSGLTFDGMARCILDEVVTVNRVGVLVDYPAKREGLTVAQAEAEGVHVFARVYETEAILDYDDETRGAHQVLTQVRLMESVSVKKADDEYTKENVDQIRELRLDDGVYSQQLWRKTGTKGEWAKHDEPIIPQKDGKPLDFIPFRFFNDLDGLPTSKRPVLMDVADVSVAHLNNSAAYEWGLMWTGNPTPCFKGLKLEEGDTLALGSSEGIQLDENGDAFFLEFSGAGLGQLEKAMAAKRNDMAVLGARMLLEEKKGIEAAETARIYRSGEQSVLANICNTVSRGMTQVLKWMIEWEGKDSKDASYEINKEFLNGQLSFEDLKSALELYQAGRITRQTLFTLLVKGNVVDQGTEYEDYEGLLEDEAPSFDSDGSDDDLDDDPEPTTI